MPEDTCGSNGNLPDPEPDNGACSSTATMLVVGTALSALLGWETGSAGSRRPRHRTGTYLSEANNHLGRPFMFDLAEKPASRGDGDDCGPGDDVKVRAEITALLVATSVSLSLHDDILIMALVLVERMLRLGFPMKLTTVRPLVLTSIVIAAKEGFDDVRRAAFPRRIAAPPSRRRGRAHHSRAGCVPADLLRCPLTCTARMIRGCRRVGCNRSHTPDSAIPTHPTPIPAAEGDRLWRWLAGRAVPYLHTPRRLDRLYASGGRKEQHTNTRDRGGTTDERTGKTAQEGRTAGAWGYTGGEGRLYPTRRYPRIQVVTISDFRRGLPHLRLKHLPSMEREMLEFLDWDVTPCREAKWRQYTEALSELLQVQKDSIRQFCFFYGDVLNDIVAAYGVESLDLEGALAG